MSSNSSLSASRSCRVEESELHQHLGWALALIILAHVVTLGVYVYLVATVPFRRNVPWNERVFNYLLHSPLGSFISLLHAILSLIACVLFMIESYVVRLDGSCEHQPLWFMLTELSVQPMFVWHYFLLLALHHHKWDYIFSIPAIVDKVTVIPVYVDLIWVMMLLLRNEYPNSSTGAAFGFFRILRAIKVVRLLRFMKSAQHLANMGILKNTQDQEAHLLIMRIVMTVVLLVIMSTGLVQFVSSYPNVAGFYISTEDTVRPLLFHEALYFTIVTLSTVGYGDVIPATDMSRALAMVIILVFLFALPFQSAQLIEFNAMRSKYRGQYNTVDRHIVVCCDPECTGVELFLHEFLHPDHGVSNIQVVLLVPSEPSPIFKELVVKYAKTQRVRYLRGDLLSNEDLLRVRLDVAIGCFILADKHSRNPDATDAMTVLRAISAHNHRPLMRTIVQLIEPRNKQYLTAVGISESNIVCIDQLRMRIAAQGCLIPGFATLFANLITSLSTERVGGWMGDYMHGLDQETYAEELPEWFVGCRYSDVAMSVYHEYGVLLIGVVLHDYVHVVLNPGMHFKIRSGDIGLFLTSNTAHLDQMLGDELEVKIPAEIKEFAAARVRQFTKAWRKACEGISTTWNRDELREASKLEAKRRLPLKRASSTPHVSAARVFKVEATRINPSPATSPPPPPPPRVRPIELPLAPSDEAVCARRELAASASEGEEEREGVKWRRHSTDTVRDTARDSRQRDAMARGDPPVRRWSEGMVSALSPESVAYMQSRWPSRSTRATKDSNLRSLSAWLAGAINARPQRRTKSNSSGRCKPGRSAAYLDEDFMRLRRSLTEPKPFVWQRRCSPAATAREYSVNLQKSKKTVRDAIASRLKRGTSVGYAAANSKWSCLQQLAAANQLKDYQHIGGRSQNAVSRTVGARAIDTALLHCANNGEVQLSGHIVIVCPSLAGLVDFIAPLRQPSVTSRSIVIVCTMPTVPVSTELRRHWAEICQFADVSILASKGETTLHEDLVRAAVSHAAAVVVLSLAAHALQYSSPIARTIDSVEITMRRDARTVLATLEVEKRCPQETQIICELHNGKVLRQLSAGVRMETMTEKVRRETNSLKQQLQTGKWMDATEEPKGLLSILDEYSISTQAATASSDMQDLPEMVPAYMSGKIMLSDMSDKLASQAFFNPHIMPMMSALLNPSLHNHRAHGAMQALTSNGQPLLQSAHLCAIEVPEDFISLCQQQGQPQSSNDSIDDVGPRMEWGYLWDFLMEEFSAIGLAVFVTEEAKDSSWSIATRLDAFSQEGVCSALRRRMSVGSSRARATSTESSSRNPSKSVSAFGPYVVTNPERSFKLRETDCVYCFLSPRLLATKRLSVLEGLQNTRASRAVGHTTSHQRNLSRVSIAQSTKRLESPDRLNDPSPSSSSTRPRARQSVSSERRPAWGRPALRRAVPSSPPASPPDLSDIAARPPPALPSACSLGPGSISGAACNGGLEAEVRTLREQLAAEQRRADELNRLLQLSLQAQGETRPACLLDGTSGEAGGTSAGERWC